MEISLKMMDPGSPSSPDHQHNDKGNHQNHHPEKGAEEEFHHQESEPSFHGLDTGMSFVRTIEKRIKNFMHRIEDDYEHLQEGIYHLSFCSLLAYTFQRIKLNQK